MKRGVLLLVLGVLLFAPSVSSIGLSPIKYDVQFEPFLERTFDLTVINTGTSPVNATVKFGGPLSTYILYQPEIYSLIPGSSRTLNFTLKLPEALDTPGKNTIDIIANEIPLSSSGQIIIGTASVIKLNLYIPYPGKYLELGSSLPDVNTGEPVTLQLYFSNLGNENLTSVQGLADLVDMNGAVITTFKTTTFSLPSKEKASKTLTINGGNLLPGAYHVTYFAAYDGKTTPSNDALLRVGTLFVNVTNYTSSFIADQINRFELLIASMWNTKIDNVYADIVIKQGDRTLTNTLTTLNTYVDSWDKKTLTAFFDASHFIPGSYDAHITLHYQNTTSVFTVPVQVSASKKQAPLYFLSLVIFLFFFITVELLLLFMRRKKEKNALSAWKHDLDKDLLGERSSRDDL